MKVCADGLHGGLRICRAGMLAVVLGLGWASWPVSAGEGDDPLAVTHVTIVTGDGRVIPDGTILMEKGRITAVGADVVVPAYAEVIDAAGHFAYPGFIDAHSHLGVPKKPRTEVERRRVEDEVGDAKQGPFTRTRAANRRGIRPELRVDDVFAPVEWAVAKHRRIGFAAALIAPRPEIQAGTSSLMNLTGGPMRRAIVLRDAGQHAGFKATEPGGYPGALLGAIAQFRQVMYDAGHYAALGRYAQRHPQSTDRPAADRALDALQGVLRGHVPLVFHADTEAEIHRALDLAEEFTVNVMISGGAEAWRVADRLAFERVPVIVSLEFPEEPEYGKKPAEGEPTSQPTTQPVKKSKLIYEPLKLRQERRRLWDERVTNAIRLQEAGVLIAFSTQAMEKPAQALKNVRRIMERGLSEEAAMAALSANPAKMFGLERRMGTLAPGQAAHVTILDKRLVDAKGKVKWVVVAGRKFEIRPGEGKGGTAGAKAGQLAAGEKGPSPSKGEVEPPVAEQPSSAPAFLVDKEPTWRCEIEADRVPPLRTDGQVFIKDATIIPVTGPTLARGSILVRDGKIAAIGESLSVPADVAVIEGEGLYVVPGFVDAHAHISADSINEGALAISAETRIADVLRSRSVSMYRALAGGTTSALILHGSANPIGGQSQVIKMKYGRPVREMILQEAPATIKFALGENVTQANWGQKQGQRFPDTRMGVEATLRRAFTAAEYYALRRQQVADALAGGRDLAPLRRDLRLDALVEVLEGRRNVHCHCYRADEILRLIDVAEDFGFRIACLQHVLEGYRVAPEIARHGCGASTFSNHWAYKVEAYDAIPHNAAFLTDYGICASINSDSASLMRFLNQEAAKSIRWGGLDELQTLRLVTINPARQLGIADQVGSIEVGKDADLAIFNGHPLNSLSRCRWTLIDGEVYFQDAEPSRSMERPLPVLTAGTPLTLAKNRSAYAIIGATVHPITSAPIPNGTVVIEEGNISAVGTNVEVPAGAEVIDVAGLHVYPGLIDAASGLGMLEVGQVRSTRDNSDTAKFSADLRITGSINSHSAHIAIARTAGITTAAPRPGGGMVAGQSAVIGLSGWTLPEMLIRETFGLHVRLPVLPLHMKGKTTDKAKRRKEHQTQKREIDAFFDRAKRYAARVRAAREDRSLSLEPDLTLQAMEAYVRGDKPVVFDASSYKEIIESLEFAEKHGLRCVIHGGQESWKLADVLAEKGISVILKDVTSLPKGRFEAFDSVYRCAAALEESGVQFCFGTGTSSGAYDLPFMAGLASAFGLDPARAEYGLTLGAAKVLGIDDQTGAIEVGKRADLIVTTHSPLQTVCQVRAMFIHGQPVDLTANKHTWDYERFKKRPVPDLPPPKELLGPPSLTSVSSRTP
ncbi:MAG: amidohydrolase family protein [Phycisphaerae bacterium]